MRKGFSLVELSIVLVILGLLVGGILAGKSLIRASEMRATIAQIQSYRAAMFSFYDKFSAVPGDMANATTYWGAVNPSAATCRTLPSSSTATCDGNGDGAITTMDGGVTYSEYFHAWKQLANAGVVAGNFTGVKACTSVACSKAGENAPEGKMANSGFSFANIPAITTETDPNWFYGSYGNFIWFGGYTGGDMGGTILNGKEAWNIDLKADDGAPNSGKIMTQKAQTACYLSSGADYNLLATTGVCALMIMMGV